MRFWEGWNEIIENLCARYVLTMIGLREGQSQVMGGKDRRIIAGSVGTFPVHQPYGVTKGAVGYVIESPFLRHIYNASCLEP
jgi:hypothetical protein